MSIPAGRPFSTVDVVVPCYNYGHYLSACVRSVLSQRGVEVRVLIIDDCSSDGSAAKGRQLAAEDDRVAFRRHEINRGHIATYNEGLMEWSTGKYVVLLSADDLLAPGSLSRAAQIMDADESIGLVYGRAIYFEKDTELPGSSGDHRWRYTRWPGSEWIERRCRHGNNVISSPEVVVRGTVQRAVGGYRAELPHAGDLEMWLRIAAVSNIAYVRRIPQAFYRVHAASMLRTKYRSTLADLQQRKAAFDSFFHSQRTVEGARLQAMANRALAREALWRACRAYDRNQVKEAGATELVRFAIGTDAAARSLAEYFALCRRRRLGPLVCNRTQVFAMPALLRRTRIWFMRERWKRQGV